MGAVRELQAKLYRLAFSRFMLSKSREAMRGSGHIRLPPGRSEGSAGRQLLEVRGGSQRGAKTKDGGASITPASMEKKKKTGKLWPHTNLYQP